MESKEEGNPYCGSVPSLDSGHNGFTAGGWGVWNPKKRDTHAVAHSPKERKAGGRLGSSEWFVSPET